MIIIKNGWIMAMNSSNKTKCSEEKAFRLFFRQTAPARTPPEGEVLELGPLVLLL